MAAAARQLEEQLQGSSKEWERRSAEVGAEASATAEGQSAGEDGSPQPLVEEGEGGDGGEERCGDEGEGAQAAAADE